MAIKCSKRGYWRKSAFLTTRASFGSGLASVFEFGLSHYRLSINYGHKADRRALANDWKRVGRDFYVALDEYAKEQTGKT